MPRWQVGPENRKSWQRVLQSFGGGAPLWWSHSNFVPQPIVSLVQSLTWEMWQTKWPLFRQQLMFSHIGKPLSKQSSVAEQEEEKKRWRYLNRTGLCKTIVRENGLCKEVRMVCAKGYELLHKWRQLVWPLTTTCRQTIKFAEFGAAACRPNI